jgi:hypothetical protein
MSGYLTARRIAMRACVVHSVDIDSSDAVAELIAGANDALGDSVPRVAMLFAGIDHEFDIVLNQLNAAWPGLALIGCTTDGEMSSHILFAEDSLALILLCGDDFHAVSGVAKSVSTDVTGSIRTSANDAVQRLAASGGGNRAANGGAANGSDATSSGSAPRLCITMPDGLTVSGSAALNALRAELGDAVPIFGGTAGDQWRFKGTKQFHGTEVLEDSVPFLLFGEGVVFSFGVDTGWRPIGREGRVTDVTGHVVRAIDGQPATAFYREFLGNADITHLTEYPLAVAADDGRGYYLRAPGRTDEAAGSIHFLGDVPAGARVHITTTNRDQILDATRSSFQHALDDFPKAAGRSDGNARGADGSADGASSAGGASSAATAANPRPGKPALALCISCAGRKQILGSRTQEEGRIVSELLGDVPAAGFYGYGEIARLAKDGISHYHNETFTTLLLGSRAASI